MVNGDTPKAAYDVGPIEQRLLGLFEMQFENAHVAAVYAAGFMLGAAIATRHPEYGAGLNDRVQQLAEEGGENPDETAYPPPEEMDRAILDIVEAVPLHAIMEKPDGN